MRILHNKERKEMTMTKCEEIGCFNVRHDPELDQGICDGNWPRPDGYPLDEDDMARVRKNRFIQKLDIVKMLTVSTCHVTKKTFDALYQDGITNKIGLPVYGKSTCDNKINYGLYVYLDNAEKANIPEDLAPLIKLAQDNGCAILCLDSDGMVLDDTEIFDW